MPKQEEPKPTTADFLKSFAEGAVKAVATGEMAPIRAPIDNLVNRAKNALEAEAAAAGVIETKGESHVTRQQSRTAKSKRRPD